MNVSPQKSRRSRNSGAWKSRTLFPVQGLPHTLPVEDPPSATVSTADSCLASKPGTSSSYLQATCLARRPAGYDATMGKLIDRKRREQIKQDRASDRTAILEAARKAFLSQSLGELTLEALDRTAKVRQGTASIHFGSLEGLVFRLLREETSSWLGHLEIQIQGAPERLPPTDLAELLAASLRDRPLLCRLLALLPAMADRHTVEMNQILDLETWRLQRFEETGALVESRCPELGTGGGFVILRRAVLLAGALEPLVNPPSGLLLAMNNEALSSLYPDAGEELQTLLTAVISGLPLIS